MFRSSNDLLAAFGSDVELIRPHLREQVLSAGQVLFEPGDRVRQVVFPDGGVISKLVVFEDGAEIESALVGREGAVGALAMLGLRQAVTRDVCQVRTRAWCIDCALLLEACETSGRIHDALDRYCAWEVSCAIRNGACNARHAVEPRLCRWLLSCSDVLQEPEIPLSQEVFAKMLGVQRTSVNPILQRLRADGLIELRRSRVMLLDRAGLIHRACECYAATGELHCELTAPLGRRQLNVLERSAVRS